MNISIIIPTKSINDLLLIKANDYIKKTAYPFIVKPVFLAPKENQSLLGQRMLEKTSSHFSIALSEKGKSYDSLGFSKYLNNLLDKKSPVAFLIGGDEGLDKKVIDNCNDSLSLSNFTLPHRMAFLVLCEQIYRASLISKGHPYHRI